MDTTETTEPLSHWQHTAWLRPILVEDLPASAEVAVVGGGIVGAFTAYWLARAGAKPVLIEAGRAPNGATGRNGGLVVPGAAEGYPGAIARLGHDAARAVVQLSVEGLALLREVIQAEDIACDYRTPGHLNLALSDEEHAEQAEAVALLRRDTFSAELLGRAQTQALVRTPLASHVVGAMLLPQGGALHSARLVLGLLEAARRHGARVVEGAPVSRVVAEGGDVRVETARGALSAGSAVLALNAFAGDLVPALQTLITPVRGQVLAYEPLPPVFATGCGAHITPTGEYWQQTPDGAIMIGGCRAVSPNRDVGERALAPTPEVQAAIEGVLPQLFPALGPLRVARRWCGPMAFSPDYLPIVDRAPGYERVLFAGGFSGHGMPFGAPLGKLLASSSLSGGMAEELWPFRLDRPTLR
jgi:glycine/D-amino acid oxidase-like deaminating enzyme